MDFNTSILAQTKSANVAVFLMDSSNDFVYDIREKLENIQKENPQVVEYSFYDGKSNQEIQNADIDEVLKEGTDLILLNIVDRAYAQNIIEKIKQVNIPVILFNREPLTLIPIQSYGRAIYIGTDPIQAGKLQGEMLIDVWNTSKKILDKNDDGIMQYFMLQGQSDIEEAIQRTKYSILTIENSGIKTQQIALDFADWDEEVAYNATKSVFEKYKDKIEVIIANNDSMAIGAVKALQESGYNKGDKFKTIPIVGVDVIGESKEFIENGYMLGSVYQDPEIYAKILYSVGNNMINSKSPVANTKYKIDDTNVSIRIPIENYLYKNIFVE